jgi:hypothetical protein
LYSVASDGGVSKNAAKSLDRKKILLDAEELAMLTVFNTRNGDSRENLIK